MTGYVGIGGPHPCLSPEPLVAMLKVDRCTLKSHPFSWGCFFLMFFSKSRVVGHWTKNMGFIYKKVPFQIGGSSGKVKSIQFYFGVWGLEAKYQMGGQNQTGFPFPFCFLGILRIDSQDKTFHSKTLGCLFWTECWMALIEWQLLRDFKGTFP